MKKINVSVIIINYKTTALVNSCIDSIINKTKDLTYEIIVVDNSNNEEEFRSLELTIKGKVDLLLNPHKNLGFGRANNYAAKFAHGEALFFLNSDTLLLSNSIFQLYKTLCSNSKIGIVGGNLYKPNGKPCHSYIKREMDVKTFKHICSIMYSIKANFFHRSDFNYSKKEKNILGYVTGADLMIFKSIFNQLGGFGNKIFMYGEDSLLCYRCIHELHMEIKVTPKSKIAHLEGGSDSTYFSDQKIYNYIEGNSLYYMVAFGKPTSIFFLKMLAKEYSRKSILFKFLGIKTKSLNCARFAEVANNRKQIIESELK